MHCSNDFLNTRLLHMYLFHTFIHIYIMRLCIMYARIYGFCIYHNDQFIQRGREWKIKFKKKTETVQSLYFNFIRYYIDMYTVNICIHICNMHTRETTARRCLIQFTVFVYSQYIYFYVSFMYTYIPRSFIYALLLLMKRRHFGVSQIQYTNKYSQLMCKRGKINYYTRQRRNM